MIKLKDLISEGPKPRAGDYVRDKRTKELGKVNKIKGNRMAYVKFPSNKKSFLPMDVSKWKPSGKQNVGRTIWTEGLITEGKITSDVDRAAKKHGIKFKKKVKTKITNDFTGSNEKPERVKYDDWMDYNPQNYEVQGRALVNALSGRYIMLKNNKYANGASAVFINYKKDPKSKFTITYHRSMSGPYISYEGVKGQ